MKLVAFVEFAKYNRGIPWKEHREIICEHPSDVRRAIRRLADWRDENAVDCKAQVTGECWYVLHEEPYLGRDRPGEDGWIEQIRQNMFFGDALDSIREMLAVDVDWLYEADRIVSLPSGKWVRPGGGPVLEEDLYPRQSGYQTCLRELDPLESIDRPFKISRKESLRRRNAL